MTCEVSRIWSRDDLENLDHEKLHDMSPEKPWKCFAWTLMMLSCCAMCLQMMIKRERHCLKYGMSLLVFVIGFLIFAQPHILPGIPKQILGQVCPSSSEVGWSLGNLSMPMSLLLSAVECNSESQFWLLDSGAAATVINKNFLDCFEHTDVIPCVQCYFAASGSPVHMDGMCVVSGRLKVLNTQTKREEMKRVSFSCLVGRTQHNILSTNLCNDQGWNFVLSKSNYQMTHEAYHLSALEIVVWGKCPWCCILRVMIPSLKSRF